MIEEVKAPEIYDTNGKVVIFCAGSIEQGTATKWSQQVVELFQEDGNNYLLLNPRRDKWDSSLKQDINNYTFREQVEWELDGLYKAKYIIMYLEPDTKSPISLLELGLHANSGKLLVCCPEGFWRKGNVDIVCARYGIKMFKNLKYIVAHIQLTEALNKKNK